MQNLELLYVAAPIVMGGVIIFQARKTGVQTISHAALGKKASRYVLIWGLILAAIVFAKLRYSWFIPYFDLGQEFKLLVAVLVVSQVLTAIFPVEGKNVDMLHMAFGGVLALCMVVFVACLAVSTQVNSVIRIVDCVLLAAMILSAATSRWTRHLSPNQFFGHELIFFALWHTVIFVTVYLG